MERTGPLRLQGCHEPLPGLRVASGSAAASQRLVVLASLLAHAAGLFALTMLKSIPLHPVDVQSIEVSLVIDDPAVIPAPSSSSTPSLNAPAISWRLPGPVAADGSADPTSSGGPIALWSRPDIRYSIAPPDRAGSKQHRAIPPDRTLTFKLGKTPAMSDLDMIAGALDCLAFTARSINAPSRHRTIHDTCPPNQFDALGDPAALPSTYSFTARNARFGEPDAYSAHAMLSLVIPKHASVGGLDLTDLTDSEVPPGIKAIETWVGQRFH